MDHPVGAVSHGRLLSVVRRVARWGTRGRVWAEGSQHTVGSPNTGPVLSVCTCDSEWTGERENIYICIISVVLTVVGKTHTT